MVRKREGYRLDAWLERLAASESSRTSAICGWSGEGQSGGESGPHLARQQRSGRGTGDEIETHQTHHVWESGISSSAPTGSPRRLTIYQHLPP